ncbi:hypothetical protein J4H86_21380 [Spiractinospora alimapuensis]|uniref:divisome protein SepX/GlpR n=1 Tax=Spiractinospora alimapuensis TaxID=2820884 RepID=UPI001F1A569E|nr:hypothetical protein [Spiractinospora alimapuensis]QVQ51341.1 hypothetical protein J4H86_21380 [Spiractinospora alimapuensis]
MTSSPLYLAIVAVWAVVLVPMLLRRDAADTTWVPRRESNGEDTETEMYDEGLDDHGEAPHENDPHDTHVDLGDSVESTAPRSAPVRRATVMARRRRRTSGLLLLLILTAAAAISGIAQWWVVAPPTILFIGHCALLREAAKIDAERRVQARIRRAAQRAEEQRRAEAEHEAKVIELASRRRGVYDQYADAHLRAAGD